MKKLTQAYIRIGTQTSERLLLNSMIVFLIIGITGCSRFGVSDTADTVDLVDNANEIATTPTVVVKLSGKQGCFSVGSEYMCLPEDSDAAPPLQIPIMPGGSAGYSHYVFEYVDGEVVATLVEGPRDEQIRVPVSYSQLKQLQESGQVPSDLNMSYEDLSQLVEQLNSIRASTQRFHDVRVATEAGYIQSTDEVPNMGAHFVHPVYSMDGIFDPTRPEILLYTRDDVGQWELVGTSFVQPLNVVGSDHPTAFIGSLDNWHIHYHLCTGAKFRSRSATKSDCKKAGGLWVPTYGWMIHAWVWVDNPLGVFNMWNPNIRPIYSPDDKITTANFVGDYTVSIEKFGFSNLSVKSGDTVSWSNTDSVTHTVTAEPEGINNSRFDSGKLDPGSSFSFKFDEPGQFSYTCTLHPYMSGVVVVKP